MIEVTNVVSRDFRTGDIVQHFKRETIDGEKGTQYLYMIISADVTHTETKEQMVAYRALYGDCKTYVRPYDMFMSEVDHIKYPNIKQKYRFELYER